MDKDKLLAQMRLAEAAAFAALRRYKFLTFGHNADVWNNLNSLLPQRERLPNPFKNFVDSARERTLVNQAAQEGYSLD